MKLLCPTCGTVEASIPFEVFKRKRKLNLPLTCPICKGTAEPEYLSKGAKPSDNLTRSKRQEKRVAVREGGKRQPRSGGIPGFEGDVRATGKYRGECKFTRSSSYRLCLSDLKKLEQQACAGELPVFDLEFQSESPSKRYVVLPEWVYETLMSESGRREQ